MTFHGWRSVDASPSKCGRIAGAAVGLLCAMCTPAHGQVADAMPGRVEAAVGVVWTGRASFGSRDATETTGTGGTFRLFTATTELAAAPGVDARVGVRAAHRVDIEGHGAFAAPELRTQITADAEPANAPILIRDSVQRFEIGADALWYPTLRRAPERMRVFVAGGAGYLRQLEDSGTVIISGATFDVGGGIKLLLKSRATGSWNAVGVRVDARALIRSAATAVDARAHVSPAIGGSVFVRF